MTETLTLRERESKAHVAFQADLERFEAVDTAFDAMHAAGFRPTKVMFNAYGKAGANLRNTETAWSILRHEFCQAADDDPQPEVPSPANLNAPLEFDEA